MRKLLQSKRYMLSSFIPPRSFSSVGKNIALVCAIIYILSFRMSELKAQPPREIIGYYPAWQWYDREGLVNPQTIPYSKYSIINYAFFKPNFDGTLSGLDLWADENLLQGKINYQTNPQSHYPNTSLVDLAHLSGVKVLISIGGWTQSFLFSGIANDPRKRKIFASDCRRIVELYNIDGIDIDWEYPGVTERDGKAYDKRNFTLLLQSIRDSLNNLSQQTGRKYLLTAAVSASKSYMTHIEWSQVIRLLDAINLMSYDFHGSWNSETGHNSPLFATAKDDSPMHVDGAVQTLMKTYGVPASKINIGAAFYGRSMKTQETPDLMSATTGKVDSVIFQEDEGSPQFYNIVKSKFAFEEHWDDYAKVPYLTGKHDINTFVSYDNQRSIAIKGHYIRAKKLRGAIVWEMTGDCIQTEGNSFKTPLIDALIAGLKNPLPIAKPSPKKIIAPKKRTKKEPNDSISDAGKTSITFTNARSNKTDSTQTAMVNKNSDGKKSDSTLQIVATMISSGNNADTTQIVVAVVEPQKGEKESVQTPIVVVKPSVQPDTSQTVEAQIKPNENPIDSTQTAITAVPPSESTPDSLQSDTLTLEADMNKLDFNIKPNDDGELILLFEMKDKREVRVEVADAQGHILRGVILGDLEDGHFQQRIEKTQELPAGWYKVIFKTYINKNGTYIKLSETIKDWEKK